VTDSKNIIRPLTPHEARALQKPAVQAEVANINDKLLRGSRRALVWSALLDDLIITMRGSGWGLQSSPGPNQDTMWVDIVEIDDTATAEAIGAKLTGQART
jgi:hypothetical protein